MVKTPVNDKVMIQMILNQPSFISHEITMLSIAFYLGNSFLPAHIG